MNSIVIPNENYDFANLHLATPISIQGGAFFTKLLNNNNDIYIQTPKSTTKQGFVKSGKKIHCDLMFDKSNGDFIEWFENLENKIIDLINNKSSAWFQDEIEHDDIENAFASPVKVYKSGNYYLVRCYVETPRMAQSTNQLTIFDESENEVAMENINEESNIISILQIHGVKFTPKSFQLYIQIKQVMQLSNSLFKKCIIKHNSIQNNNLEKIETLDKNNIELESENNIVLKDLEKKEDHEIEEDIKNNLSQDLVPYVGQDVAQDIIPDVAQDVIPDVPQDVIPDVPQDVDIVKKSVKEEDNNLSKVNHEDKKDDDLENSLETINAEQNENILEECDIDINLDNLETISLKKPEKIYYDIYLKAKEKAKNARKMALEAYLELKEIKSNYMINEIDDSDEEEISEINEV
tara:strand:+ start:464 stop:1687 length:1224 start_codon:yes stop_codon:yes gene_type:complete